MSHFSAPINPERPRGGPSCAKCSHSFTMPSGNIHILVCDFGRRTSEPCAAFCDASVDRTERGGLKAGYFVARAA